MRWLAFEKTTDPQIIATRFEERVGHLPASIMYPPGATFTAESWRACVEKGILIGTGKPARNVALAGPIGFRP